MAPGIGEMPSPTGAEESAKPANASAANAAEQPPAGPGCVEQVVREVDTGKDSSRQAEEMAEAERVPAQEREVGVANEQVAGDGVRRAPERRSRRRTGGGGGCPYAKESVEQAEEAPGEELGEEPEEEAEEEDDGEDEADGDSVRPQRKRSKPADPDYAPVPVRYLPSGPPKKRVDALSEEELRSHYQRLLKHGTTGYMKRCGKDVYWVRRLKARCEQLGIR